MQLILNLAGDSLTDLSGGLPRRSAPALVVGVFRSFQTISTGDIEDLIGVVLRPGGFAPLLGLDADEFSEQETCLYSALGQVAEQWRSQLREVRGGAARLQRFEALLLGRLARSAKASRCALTDHVLTEIARGTPIAELVRRSGRGPRHLRDTFRRNVGVTPKIFHRIQRFQQAMDLLRCGREVRWAELALRCGFYDQAHFAHEFRSFSGICPTHYSAMNLRWKNHIPVRE